MNRNRLALSAALVAAALATGPRPARANDCTSATPVLGEVWSKFKEVVGAAGCAYAASQTGVDYDKCLDAADKIKKADGLLLKFWNELAANGPASIGPRVIPMNKPASGKIVGTSERVFYSARPATKNPVIVKLTKVSGAEHVKVTVCTADQDKKCTIEETGEWQSDAKDGAQITKTLNGVKGKVIVVHLAAARLNFKHLAYKIQIQN